LVLSKEKPIPYQPPLPPNEAPSGVDAAAGVTPVGLRPPFVTPAAAHSHPDCRGIPILIVAPHRYAGLTGSPDESGSKRREKGLSRSGNARVRKIMIQLAWRMVKFQPDSALVQWFKQRTESTKGSRKPMIVALARKLIIALWRYANDGVIPEGFRLHSAA
jgi:hypothetical protein